MLRLILLYWVEIACFNNGVLSSIVLQTVFCLACYGFHVDCLCSVYAIFVLTPKTFKSHKSDVM